MDTRLAGEIVKTLKSSQAWAMAATIIMCSNLSAVAVTPPAQAEKSTQTYSSALKEIDSLTQARSFYKARKILEPLLESKPKDANVHVRAGRLFSQMGLLPRAIDEYRTVISLDPRNSSAYVELSKIYLASENTNDATTYAKEALKLNPNSSDTRILLVKILMAKGLLLEAEQELQRLLRGDPHDAQVHYMAAKIYRERGQGALALQHIDQAIQLNPDNHEWLMEMSDICILLGRDDEAKAALLKLLKYEPDSVEGLSRLARVKENSFRDYDGAMESYKRVLEIDPDSVTALAGIERLRAKKNDLAGLWKHQLKNFFAGFFPKKN